MIVQKERVQAQSVLCTSWNIFIAYTQVLLQDLYFNAFNDVGSAVSCLKQYSAKNKLGNNNELCSRNRHLTAEIIKTLYTHNTALPSITLLLIYSVLTACLNSKYLLSSIMPSSRLVPFRIIDVKVLLKPTLHAFWRGEQEIGPSEAERCIPITQLGSEPLVESGFVA